MAKKRKIAPKKKKRRIEPEIQAHVHTSFNNTIITMTDLKGNTLNWSSSGKIGNKGSRKSTSFAAQQAATIATEEAINMGGKKVHIFVKGPGPGRETSIRAIQVAGLKVLSISDVTPIPHNGCRPPKQRRI